MIKRIAPALVLLGTVLIMPAHGEDLGLFNYSSYINSSGLPVVAGEIVNYGSEPVKSVEVSVSFMDGTGQVIDSSHGTVAATIIPPGQKAPFMLVGSSAYAHKVSSYELKIVNFAETQQKPLALEIASVSESSNGIKELTIRGEVKNMGSDSTRSTHVYATFYDGSGKVVGYSSAPVDLRTIEPNGKSSFTVRMHEEVSSIRIYTLFAESDRYSMVPFGIKSLDKPASAASKVSISRLSVVDHEGQGTGKVSMGERVWIKSDLKNELSTEQKFTYIVQIKDGDGLPVTINWMDGILTPDMGFAPKLSWVPEDGGVYFAEIFVWQSLENPVPLSSSIRTIILFVEE
ncbi:MAG: FxLYD domain-containing protein [Nitrososphaerales archaeon]